MLTYDYEPTDAQVHKRRRSVYIIMVWDGGVLRDRIQKICDSFSGERFDVPRLLAAADLALLTSRSEGLSNTILEAMACGLPVLATDVGGNAELVNDGETGYLLPVHEADPIAARVTKLLQDIPLAEKMGRRGREILEERYSLESLVERAGRYYERVIHGG